MKKLIFITLTFLFAGSIYSFSQETATKPTTGKVNQNNLYNEVYASYGLGSMMFFAEHDNLIANSTSGTIMAGYARSLNKVVVMGFQVSYTYMGRSGTTSGYYYSTSHNIEDNYMQGLVNIRFRYLSKQAICMYSGVALGVTMNSYTNTEGTTSSHGRQLFPAGQLTFIGIRVGHALGFFGEFGVGTNYIINAGLSYKFGDDF
jgi:hypothetical protein